MLFRSPAGGAAESVCARGWRRRKQQRGAAEGGRGELRAQTGLSSGLQPPEPPPSHPRTPNPIPGAPCPYRRSGDTEPSCGSARDGAALWAGSGESPTGAALPSPFPVKRGRPHGRDSVGSSADPPQGMTERGTPRSSSSSSSSSSSIPRPDAALINGEVRGSPLRLETFYFGLRAFPAGSNRGCHPSHDRILRFGARHQRSPFAPKNGHDGGGGGRGPRRHRCDAAAWLRGTAAPRPCAGGGGGKENGAPQPRGSVLPSAAGEQTVRGGAHG